MFFLLFRLFLELLYWSAVSILFITFSSDVFGLLYWPAVSILFIAFSLDVFRSCQRSVRDCVCVRRRIGLASFDLCFGLIQQFLGVICGKDGRMEGWDGMGGG